MAAAKAKRSVAGLAVGSEADSAEETSSATPRGAGSAVAGAAAADSAAAGSVEGVVGSEEEATQLERLGADAGVVG